VEKEKKRAEAKIEEVEKEAQLTLFTDIRFPGVHNIEASDKASEHKKHDKAQLIQQPLVMLTPPPTSSTRRIASAILGLLKQADGKLAYGSEADIHSYVIAVLQDGIRAAGLEVKLRFQREYSIAALRPDIILILSPNNVPIGVIEIKLPDDTIMKSEYFFGQGYDYLKVLFEMYGVQKPFAILTNYLEWRFCWLPVADDLAQMDDDQFDKVQQSTLTSSSSSSSQKGPKTKADIPFVKEEGGKSKQKSKDDGTSTPPSSTAKDDD